MIKKNEYKSNMTIYAELLATTNPIALKVMLQRGEFEGTYLRGLELINLNLRGANFKNTRLIEVDFRGSFLNNSDFSYSYISRSNFIYTNLQNTNFEYASLNRVDFSDGQLTLSNFRNAEVYTCIFNWARLNASNFNGANIDYSSFPFWCGTLGMKIDSEIAYQMLYHFCSLDINDLDLTLLQSALIPAANKFRRVINRSVDELFPKIKLTEDDILRLNQTFIEG